MLADHRRLRRAPELLMSQRMQTVYPELMCNLAEGMFTVTNPVPKKGLLALGWREAAPGQGARLARPRSDDGWTDDQDLRIRRTRAALRSRHEPARDDPVGDAGRA